MCLKNKGGGWLKEKRQGLRISNLSPPPSQDSTQQTMLTTWIIELFLNELGSLHDTGEINAYKRLRQEFHSFLSQEPLKVGV